MPGTTTRDPLPILRRAGPWMVVLAVAAASAVVTQVGLALRQPGRFAVFWPLAGLMLGVLLSSPGKLWPALVTAAAASAAASQVASGVDAAPSLAFAAIAMLESLLGAWLTLRICGGVPDLSRIGQLLKLVLAGPVLACGAAGLAVAGLASALLGAPFAPALQSAWSGSFLGALTVAPALLAWRCESPSRRRGAAGLTEMGALVLAIAAATWLLYGPARHYRLPVSLYLPLLLWSALRFGLRGTTASGLLVTLLVLWFTVQGIGRFADSVEVSAGLLSAQIYVAVTFLSLLAMSSVIESRRLGAEELRRKEQQLRLVRSVADATSDPLVCLDPNGTVVYANDALCALLLRERRAIVGLPIWSLAVHVTPEAWARHWERVKSRGTVTAEMLAAGLPAPGGADAPDTPAPFEIRSGYLSFRGQEFCVSAARDLRDRRRAEAALRLASIGTMAAGMAHEINNPLAYVLGNLEWMVERVREATPGAPAPVDGAAALTAVKPALEETLEGARRIRDVVRDVKLFSRSDGLGSAPVAADVVRALRGAVTLAQHEIRHRARLVQDYEQLPAVRGDEHRLGQVFLNLILNAAQAIPEGHATEHMVRVAARRLDREVLVEIEDSGCGMTAEVMAHLFEPFFTTKPVGVGTGLGLSICHGIVTALSGRIEVSSLPHRGSLFRVRLPLAGEREEDAAARTAATPEVEKHGTRV